MQDVYESWIYMMQGSSAVLITVVFLFSLLVGSFLNVVIHRVPIMLEREWKTQAKEILSQDTEQAGAERSTANLHESTGSKYNLVVPRSACPKCGAPITALQNIPVISYLFL